EDFDCLAAAVPRFASMLLAPEGDPDAQDIPIRALTQRRLRGEAAPSSPPAFKARCIAKGFSQRQGVDYFHTLSPTRVLLRVATQHDYESHSLDFSTPLLQGSLHEENWLRCPPSFTGSFPDYTCGSRVDSFYSDPPLFLRTDTLMPPFYILVYITRDKAWRTITLTQSNMVHQVLQCFGFQFSSPQLTPLCTGHSLSAPPSN
ncbi:unnamed protein product, partial [Closterium sp. NIES-53]